MVKYYRNLPHFQPKEGIFLITFRLAGSIPPEILEEMRKNYESEFKQLSNEFPEGEFLKSKHYDLQKKYFGIYDDILDRQLFGPDFLKNEMVASLVFEKIKSFDSIKYELVVLSIQPNHVHFVIMLNEDLKVSSNNKKGKTKDYILADTLRLIKGSTARYSNIILNRDGQFWHHESMDHLVRDEAELDRIINYVLNNPVKSGLVENRKDWKWNYCIYGY